MVPELGPFEMFALLVATIITWMMVGTIIGLENAEDGCCKTNTCGESGPVQFLKGLTIILGSGFTLIIVIAIVLQVMEYMKKRSPASRLGDIANNVIAAFGVRKAH